MSEFQNGLEFVRESLSKIRDSKGDSLRASLATLNRLLATPEPEPGSSARTPDSDSPADMQIASRTRRDDAGIPEPAAPTVPRKHAETRGRAVLLEVLRSPVIACEKCPHLAKSRTQVVFGVGNPEAELMFVGEAPGADEDLQGEPFVGKAGQLLTRIIETMGFRRSDVYIANVLKCRPDMPAGQTGNRRPTPSEMQTCLPYLRQQIEIIQPRVIVALGAVAMEGLIGAAEPMRNLRGRWHAFHGTPLMATYHPAYLLRNQSLSEKRKVWEDMLMVLEKLGRPITERQRNFFLKKS
jgi:uracil-DNA glycosylase family 4